MLEVREAIPQADDQLNLGIETFGHATRQPLTEVVQDLFLPPFLAPGPHKLLAPRAVALVGYVSTPRSNGPALRPADPGGTGIVSLGQSNGPSQASCQASIRPKVSKSLKNNLSYRTPVAKI